MPVPRRHSQRIGSQLAGRDSFTLVELLVAVAIGGLVLSGAVIILVSHMRASGRLAAMQHLRDHCGWVQFLINREIEQAERANPATDNGQLQLQVPGYADPITYVHDAASRQLWRTGPSIDAHGRLEAAASRRTDLVARDVEDFTVTITNPRSPRYRLRMRDATDAEYTINQDTGPDGGAYRSGGAYCRAREITRSTSAPAP